MIYTHIFLVILVTVILIIFAEYQKLRNVSWILFIVCTSYILLNIDPKEKKQSIYPNNNQTAIADSVSVTKDTILIHNSDNVISEVVSDSISTNIPNFDNNNSYNKIDSLRINTLFMATSIMDKSPQGVSRLFLNDISELFCFSVVENSVKNNKIIHNWKRYQEDYLYEQDFFKSTINIGTSPNWRCWSKINIKPEMAGDWQVIITDSLGNKLDSIEFSIIPASE